MVLFMERDLLKCDVVLFMERDLLKCDVWINCGLRSLFYGLASNANNCNIILF